MNNFDDVKKSLDSKELRVCVIGIGRIGLPTALSFAKTGLKTIGVDINEELTHFYFQLNETSTFLILIIFSSIPNHSVNILEMYKLIRATMKSNLASVQSNTCKAVLSANPL